VALARNRGIRPDAVLNLPLFLPREKDLRLSGDARP